MKLRQTILMMLTVCAAIPASAQQFFHLTADELRVDTLSAPQFTHVMPLPEAWRDSVYTVRIVYPEYAEMAAADVANYNRLVAEQPDAEPKVETHVTFDCKRASLLAAVNPIVFRDGRYKQLVSFMLRRESRAKADARRDAAAYGERADAKVNVWDTLPAAKRYAEHSVLREGRWAKIRVAESGIYQLTSALVRQAGFTDINKVKLYGYGGNLINETLDPKDLVEHDDLKEVATCDVDGKRLFYARGPVSWETETADRRTRNYYSNYGYYFLTEDTSSEPAKVDYDTFVASFYPSPDFYHDIHEQDAFSWYKGGRNFFGAQQVSQGSYMTVDIPENSNATKGNLYVVVTSSNYCKVQVEYNDSVVGTLQTSNSDSQFIYGCESRGTYRVPAVKGTAKVKLSVLSGSNPMRLDMVSMAWDKPRPLPDLKTAS
ncbi:MAG: Por secretion system protein, partial [Prevotella sp.]|nr:Por secretion system protein [Prevotella sp.]